VEKGTQLCQFKAAAPNQAYSIQLLLVGRPALVGRGSWPAPWHPNAVWPSVLQSYRAALGGIFISRYKNAGAAWSGPPEF